MTEINKNENSVICKFCSNSIFNEKIKCVRIKVTITQMLNDSSFIKIIKQVAVHESTVEIYMNTYKVKRV